MDEGFTLAFGETEEEIPEREPHGYKRWARRAASALTGWRNDSHYEAADVLFERLVPGPAALGGMLAPPSGIARSRAHPTVLATVTAPAGAHLSNRRYRESTERY